MADPKLKFKVPKNLFPFQQPELERFQTLFREHEVVLLEGAGHFIQEDAAEEICNAVHEWFPQDKETG
ncbi:MAG: hypothetical protein KAI99_02925 [Cyclobacteriaceae bacterium]|jgi:haloalkane dehalogenase|nr:hypothetical protein [Cyclobacteriaceae bacterium]